MDKVKTGSDFGARLYYSLCKSLSYKYFADCSALAADVDAVFGILDAYAL